MVDVSLGVHPAALRLEVTPTLDTPELAALVLAVTALGAVSYVLADTAAFWVASRLGGADVRRLATKELLLAAFAAVLVLIGGAGAFAQALDPPMAHGPGLAAGVGRTQAAYVLTGAVVNAMVWTEAVFRWRLYLRRVAWAAPAPGPAGAGA
jgi:hypothetical protein